jgi:hypothetical protein
MGQHVEQIKMQVEQDLAETRKGLYLSQLQSGLQSARDRKNHFEATAQSEIDQRRAELDSEITDLENEVNAVQAVNG